MTTHEDARSDRVDAVVKIDGTSHRSPLSERDLVDRLTHFLVEHQVNESIDSWTVLHKVALHMETDASKRKSLQKLQPARGKLPQGDNYAEDAEDAYNDDDDDHAPNHHSSITSPPSSAPPSQNNKSTIPTPSSHTQSTSLTHDDFTGLSKEERKKRKREAKKHEKEERRSAKKARKEAKKEAKKAKKEAKKAAKKEKRKSG